MKLSPPHAPWQVIPPERYMKTLREGAADNFLDPVYQVSAASFFLLFSSPVPSENRPNWIIYYKASLGLSISGHQNG
eukprot:1144445-Pelagomonas_calceolata.AAC.5